VVTVLPAGLGGLYSLAISQWATSEEVRQGTGQKVINEMMTSLMH